jgi:hypothetical protein
MNPKHKAVMLGTVADSVDDACPHNMISILRSNLPVGPLSFYALTTLVARIYKEKRKTGDAF